MIPTPPFTGAKDINGNPIKIGDQVWVYPQRYKEISSDTSGCVKVVEVDSSQPLPVLDVPLYAGTVQWSDYDLRFEVKVERDFGKHGIASVGLGGGNYAFHIVNKCADAANQRVKAPHPVAAGLCPVCGGDLKGEESHATYACDTCSYTLEDGFASIDESDVVDSAESPGVHILKVTQVLRLEKSITVLVKADSLQEAIDIQTDRDAPSYYDPRWHVARCDLENESVTQA